MGIDDESSHPAVVFRRCRRRYTPDFGSVCVFSESRMRETRLYGSTSGNRKQSHAKPDRGDDAKASSAATGRLKPLRLFSNLLPFTLTTPDPGYTLILVRGPAEAHRAASNQLQLDYGFCLSLDIRRTPIFASQRAMFAGSKRTQAPTWKQGMVPRFARRRIVSLLTFSTVASSSAVIAPSLAASLDAIDFRRLPSLSNMLSLTISLPLEICRRPSDVRLDCGQA
jgi:hypothetical protein